MSRGGVKAVGVEWKDLRACLETPVFWMCPSVYGALPTPATISHTTMTFPSDARTKKPQANESTNPSQES